LTHKESIAIDAMKAGEDYENQINAAVLYHVAAAFASLAPARNRESGALRRPTTTRALASRGEHDCRVSAC
jgi:hypothetical protein